MQHDMFGHDTYLATAFREVDKGSDLNKLVACLRFMEGLPSFASYKHMSIERLRLKPGDTAVDLGCGLGFDVPRLARVVGPEGLSVGIDASETLLEGARRAFSHIEGVSFQQGDIQNLGISSNSVHGVRVDRTLQHVEHPQKVISEMVRILKPRGWLVCAEPDWGTFVMDADDRTITNSVVQTWRSGFRNPEIGRQLLRRVRSEGLENTWAEGLILLADGIHAANMMFDIYATAEKVKTKSPEQARGVDAWVKRLQEREGRERATASVTIFLAGGQKPG
jgi:SAM-dependent methyltransferase